MSYLVPIAPAVPARTRLHGQRMRGLSASFIRQPINGVSPLPVMPVRILPIVEPFPSTPPMRPIGGPTGRIPPSTPVTTSPAPTSGAPTGYCIFTSSPETGGVVSVAQCSAGQGGVPIDTNPSPPAPTPTIASPVPSTWPTNQPYTDSNGNVWTYSMGSWQITGNVSSALPAPPPPSASSAPSGGAPVNVTTGGGTSYDSLINWLNSQSLISGVANFWILGGGVLAFMLIKNRGARR